MVAGIGVGQRGSRRTVTFLRLLDTNTGAVPLARGKTCYTWNSSVICRLISLLLLVYIDHFVLSTAEPFINLMTIFPQITSGEMYMVFSKRLYSRSECNNYVAALYKVIGTFLFGASVSQSLTDLAKYMIGRPRPNFIAVCDPDWKMINCSAYVTELDCRGSHANVTESR